MQKEVQGLGLDKEEVEMKELEVMGHRTASCEILHTKRISLGGLQAYLYAPEVCCRMQQIHHQSAHNAQRDKLGCA